MHRHLRASPIVAKNNFCFLGLGICSKYDLGSTISSNRASLAGEFMNNHVLTHMIASCLKIKGVKSGFSTRIVLSISRLGNLNSA